MSRWVAPVDAAQHRALTREDIYRDLVSFAPIATAEGEAVLDHMLKESFLIQDGPLLMAVFTAAPQFTVLHGPPRSA